MVYFENTVSLSWSRLFTFNIFTDSSPYLCQNAKTLNAKLSQQVNLNHSDLSKYSMRNTFSLFFALLSPTITIQQLSELSSSSDIIRQFNGRYSRICSSIVPKNSPRNFVCIVPYIVTTEFVNVAYTTRDTWSKSHVLRSHPLHQRFNGYFC